DRPGDLVVDRVERRRISRCGPVQLAGQIRRLATIVGRPGVAGFWIATHGHILYSSRRPARLARPAIRRRGPIRHGIGVDVPGVSTRRRRRWAGLLAGVLAAGMALGVGQLVAGITGPAGSP